MAPALLPAPSSKGKLSCGLALSECGLVADRWKAEFIASSPGLTDKVSGRVPNLRLSWLRLLAELTK